MGASLSRVRLLSGISTHRLKDARPVRVPCESSVLHATGGTVSSSSGLVTFPCLPELRGTAVAAQTSHIQSGRGIAATATAASIAARAIRAWHLTTFCSILTASENSWGDGSESERSSCTDITTTYKERLCRNTDSQLKLRPGIWLVRCRCPGCPQPTERYRTIAFTPNSRIPRAIPFAILSPALCVEIRFVTPRGGDHPVAVLALL